MESTVIFNVSHRYPIRLRIQSPFLHNPSRGSTPAPLNFTILPFLASLSLSLSPCRGHESSVWMFMVGAAQLPSTLLTLHELRRNELFALQGWRVGASWVLATTSYALAWVGGIVVGVLGKFSPDEYTLIRNLDWA